MARKDERNHAGQEGSHTLLGPIASSARCVTRSPPLHRRPSGEFTVNFSALRLAREPMQLDGMSVDLLLTFSPPTARSACAGLDEVLVKLPLEHAHSAAKIARVREALTSVDWHKSIYLGVDRAVAPSDDVPTQVKLSFIPNGMAVSFATQYAYPSGSVPTVVFGTSPSNLGTTATGVNGDTYGTDYFHTVLLEDLAPATTYFYQVVNDSEMYSFTTALAIGDATPFSLAMVGDMVSAN